MKKISFFIALFSASLFLYSQEKEINPKNEFGLNVNGLIDILNDNSSSNSSNYLISYKRKTGNLWLRNKIGGYIDNNQYIEDTVNYHNNSYSVNYKPGVEKQKEIIKNWTINYGIDLLFCYSKSYNENIQSSDVTRRLTSSNMKIGISPVFGIRYFINDHISLGTESWLDVYYENIFNRIRFVDNDGNNVNDNNNSDTEVKGLESSYSLPLAVYLNIRF